MGTTLARITTNAGLLFALVRLRLRHGLRERLVKVATTQRHLSVVRDEAVEAVEREILNQVVFGLATLLLWLDAAVVDGTLAPAATHRGTRALSQWHCGLNLNVSLWLKHHIWRNIRKAPYIRTTRIHKLASILTECFLSNTRIQFNSIQFGFMYSK